MKQTLGQQLLADFKSCDAARLNDIDFLVDHCIKAADAMGATVVDVHSHRYEPIGVSVVVILAESHLSLHTWPEYGLASVDIFVCNPANDPQRASAVLSDALGASSTTDIALTRGRLDEFASGPVAPAAIPDAS